MSDKVRGEMNKNKPAMRTIPIVISESMGSPVSYLSDTWQLFVTEDAE
ncbi:MAG: hypothetical protein NZ571_06330 [Anaerolineae bacterium]|nr:hypothetical protein [Anaerolineae bacterium]